MAFGENSAKDTQNALYEQGIAFLDSGKVDKAIKCFEECAKQGNKRAQYALYEYYGDNGDKNNARKWLEFLAENSNDVLDQSMVGFCFLNGRGVEKDYKLAFKWLEKAAKNGDAEGQYLLGNMYYEGFGVQKDYNKAIELVKKSAAQGLAKAQSALGLMYARGQGTQQNYKEAFKWYEKAAKQGNNNAQCILGEMYLKGDGADQNYELAAQWLEKSANQNNPEAMHMLGNLYFEGRGVKKDINKSLELAKKSAELGYVYSEGALGWLYFEGKIVKKDLNEAEKWLKRAATKGLPESQFVYALLLSDRGNINDAIVWLDAAAKQDFARASTMLGVIYLNGQGVKQDYNKAISYLAKASNLGDDYAASVLEGLRRKAQGLDE